MLAFSLRAELITNMGGLAFKCQFGVSLGCYLVHDSVVSASASGGVELCSDFVRHLMHRGHLEQSPCTRMRMPMLVRVAVLSLESLAMGQLSMGLRL